MPTPQMVRAIQADVRRQRAQAAWEDDPANRPAPGKRRRDGNPLKKRGRDEREVEELEAKLREMKALRERVVEHIAVCKKYGYCGYAKEDDDPDAGRYAAAAAASASSGDPKQAADPAADTRRASGPSTRRIFRIRQINRTSQLFNKRPSLPAGAARTPSTSRVRHKCSGRAASVGTSGCRAPTGALEVGALDRLGDVAADLLLHEEVREVRRDAHLAQQHLGLAARAGGRRRRVVGRAGGAAARSRRSPAASPERRGQRAGSGRSRRRRRRRRGRPSTARSSARSSRRPTRQERARGPRPPTGPAAAAACRRATPRTPAPGRRLPAEAPTAGLVRPAAARISKKSGPTSGSPAAARRGRRPAPPGRRSSRRAGRGSCP